jgi:selenium metabolism protein YedF
MQIIDARQKPCPQPVILTRKAIENSAAGEEVEVVVDNEIALFNVSNVLREQKIAFTSESLTGEHRVRFVNPGGCRIDTTLAAAVRYGNRVIVLKQEWMGHGSEELGRLLVKGFLNTLPDAGPLPEAIIAYNAGVRFAVEGSPVLETLQRLEIAGVKIWVCGTCVDYYGIRDQLRVGTITNMLHIIEVLNEAGTVIYP